MNNSKKPATLALLAAVCIAGCTGFLFMRKNLPYEFEFVPTAAGLRIINTTAWNNRDLIVSYSGDNGTSGPDTVIRGEFNECEIPGLHADESYTIRIRRKDLVGRLRYRSLRRDCIIPQTTPKYVVLVGASVGKAWNLPALADRTGTDGYAFGYRAKYGYDKTDVLERLVNSPQKPDIVIIKECAAYFPKELEPIRQKIPQWVGLLMSSNITPVLATCCPVTKDNDRQNPGRQAAIDEFNRFVRTFAEEQNLGVLDLEKTLRTDDATHYLRGDYARPDGLHLLPAAYTALDEELIPGFLAHLKCKDT